MEKMYWRHLAWEEFNIIMVGDYFYIVYTNALLLWEDKYFNKKVYIPLKKNTHK